MICTTSNTPIEFNDELDARVHSELLVYGYCRKQCDSFVTDDVMDIVMNYLHFPKFGIIFNPRGHISREDNVILVRLSLLIGSVTLLPAISSLLITSNYSAEDCSCTRSYSIDLNKFLTVAGGFQLGYEILSLSCIFFWTWYVDKYQDPRVLAIRCGCAGLCYLLWAAIGMYMWDQEMDSACRSGPIARMVLAWSILQYALIPVFGSLCFGVAYYEGNKSHPY